jgi:putative CocE/NonD family hydrolase
MMKTPHLLRWYFYFVSLISFLVLPGFARAEATAKTSGALPTEIPAHFKPATQSFDYVRREVMIPMRDGVKLHTVILIPKGAKRAPILLTRTPYDANKLTTKANSAHLGLTLHGSDNVLEVIIEGGYIRVAQDIRGKYGSEGDYIVTRPLRGPLNATKVDHSTDTYDTIDWLVKHVPESNGKVGIIGTSYNGFLTLMALINPHPALKVAVPMNPMVDGWMGDDWFHYGAFRVLSLSYIYEQVATRKNEEKWWSSHFDDYEMYLEAGSAGEMGRRRGMEQLGFWRKLLEHPAYDTFWQQQALDKKLAAQPLKVPTMLVHGLWDQEDIYGPIAVYQAFKTKNTHNNNLFLVMGPWHHGQQSGQGSSLGQLKFGSDTGLYFRREILGPFLAQYLSNEAAKSDVAAVTAFETGTNTWRRLQTWPSGCTGDCKITPTALYLKAQQKLSFSAPAADEAAYEEYIADPAKPIPFIPRPYQQTGDSSRHDIWAKWLVNDQREASSRTDVVTFVSDTLTAPLKIRGQPLANLIASTSGTDSDWVVKLIDLYPDEYGPQPDMGGYQLMIAADIFRGRYRESFSNPKALEPNKPLPYHFALPTTNHVFLPGHRIMVQIQSSLFPLYDRNPQTFVDNIFWAKPNDYQKATQRVYHAPGQATFIELPVVK